MVCVMESREDWSQTHLHSEFLSPTSSVILDKSLEQVLACKTNPITPARSIVLNIKDNMWERVWHGRGAQ